MNLGKNMKNYERVIGEAVRIEYVENSDKLYLVFEVTDPSAKQDIKKNWTKDIEYRIIGKTLVKTEDE
jgi:hypothetical protein